MRRLVIILFAILSMNGYAADWQQRWIHCINTFGQEQVWFRRTYQMEGHPRYAGISVVTGGKFILYVNERNVSTDVLISSKQGIRRYDVTRFLRNGDNTIAVWYVPDSLQDHHEKQLALDFYGITAKGKRFAYSTDGTWLTRHANAEITPEGHERIDATKYIANWKQDEIRRSDWLAACVSDVSPSNIPVAPYFHEAERIEHTYRYRSFSNCDTLAVYDFGEEMEGWIRVTIRGARKGETIDINGLTYTCSGALDEQACHRFTKTPCRIVVISGRSNVRDIISNVEALRIAPYRHESYQY